MLVLATILFILLSPGIIVTIPPFEFMKETTNNLAVLVHAALFFAILKMAYANTWGIFGYLKDAEDQITSASF